jgi:hypothetical protein
MSNDATYSRFEIRGYCPARHLTNDVSLRAELSRAKVLACCCASRPEQSRALVANPTGTFMRFAGASRYVGELLGGVARHRFLSQLG